MINFPEINLKNKNTLVTLFILTTLLFFLNFLEVKALVSILVVFILVNQYSTLKKNVDQKIIDQGNKTEPLLNYNNKIATLLKKLKKRYKKKSPYNFKEGMYYWKYFIKSIDTLENDKLYNYIPYFEKAHFYLQKSTNLFQSLGVEEHERTYIEGVKYNDFKNSKHLRETTKIAKELYHEGYLLLYNLSLRLNKRWKEDPNIFNKQIVLDHPLPYDKNNSEHYDFYM